jgi:hypothetical protein
VFGASQTTKKIAGLRLVQMTESKIMFRLEIGHLTGQEDTMEASQAGDQETMVTKTTLGILKL